MRLAASTVGSDFAMTFRSTDHDSMVHLKLHNIFEAFRDVAYALTLLS
jgi:hypothetical protein